MKNKFTKGKWTIQQTPESYEPKASRHEIHSDSNAGWICKVQTNGYIEKEEGIANAMLIAAAPEMFEALQSIVTYWNSPAKGSINDHINHSLTLAEKAIKKAKKQ